MGISQKTGVDLPDEAAGVMPSTMWKLKTQHDKWYAGETISVGIGQGAIEVTPLQMARAIGGIASGGVLRRPHVVFPNEIPAQEDDGDCRVASPGSGEKTVPLTARELADHYRRDGAGDDQRDRGRVAYGRDRLCGEDRDGAGDEP